MEYGIRIPTKSAYLKYWLDMQRGFIQIGDILTAGTTSCLFAHNEYELRCVCVFKERRELREAGTKYNLRMMFAD
jgi:hypothetical protein